MRYLKRENPEEFLRDYRRVEYFLIDLLGYLDREYKKTSDVQVKNSIRKMKEQAAFAENLLSGLVKDIRNGETEKGSYFSEASNLD